MSDEKKRIGLYGGSFDPVHIGHLKLALAAKEEFGLERVIFIPAKLPPHKMQKTLTPARHRLAMLRRVIEPYPFFSISRFELTNPATTYTYQTAGWFRKKYPAAELFFIIGGDSLNDLGTWRHIDKLLRLCTFIAGTRKGVEINRELPYIDAVRYITQSLPRVSSSEIRRRVKDGLSIKKLVPPGVAEYIQKHELYT